MAATLGNQFWKLRSKHGRGKLFADASLLWDAACEYFEWCQANPYIEKDWVGKDAYEVKREKERPFTLQDLCLYLDCNSAYFRVFKHQLPDGEEDFNTVITRIEEIIYAQKFRGAAVGIFNANIISRDLGLVDKKEQNVIVEQPLFNDVPTDNSNK
jgi:hypothetical protein